MKNKKIMFLLVPAVVIVWGLIIYRIAEAVSEKETQTAANSVEQPVDRRTASLPDSVKLLVNYRDPFLTGSVVSRPVERPMGTGGAVPTTPASFAPSVPAPPAKIVVWPAVQYLGMIQNSTSKTKIAIVRINGKSHLLAEAAVAGQLTVQKITPDSVSVSFQGERKHIRK